MSKLMITTIAIALIVLGIGLLVWQQVSVKQTRQFLSQDEIDELETRRKPVSQNQVDTFVKFDIKAYEDRIKQKQEGNNTGDVTYVGTNGNSFNEFAHDGGYIQKETQKDGAYIFYRVFYNTGNLKTEGKMAKFGGGNALLGEWKTYDKNGNVIKTEDYENGFKITYEAVLEICKKRNIDLNEKGISFYRSRLGQPAVWLIEWSTGEGPIPGSEVGSIGYSAGISIDGVTGVVTEIPDNGPK